MIIKKEKNKIIYRDEFKSYAWITNLDNNGAVLEIIITDEQYRNQGLARKLLSFIIDDLKRNNFEYLKLLVSPTKDSPMSCIALNKFYSSFGFVNCNNMIMILEF